MAKNEIHVSDIVEFDITIRDQNNNPVDLSNASTIQFTFERPDKTTFTVNAQWITNGKDGGIKYVTQSTDLNMAGYWQYQAYIVINANGNSSDTSRFRVFPNLPV